MQPGCAEQMAVSDSSSLQQPLSCFIPGGASVPVSWLVLGESALRAGVLPVKVRLGAPPLYLVAE